MGKGNLFCGASLRDLVPSLRLSGTEMDYAVTPLLLVSAVLGSMAAVWVSCRRAGRMSGRALAAVSAAASAVVQVNTQVSSNLNRPAELAFARSVRPAPAGCRSFYVTDGDRPNLLFFIFQLDAMFASQKVGIPTLNGYTGYHPARWELRAPGPDIWPRCTSGSTSTT